MWASSVVFTLSPLNRPSMYLLIRLDRSLRTEWGLSQRSTYSGLISCMKALLRFISSATSCWSGPFS